MAGEDEGVELIVSQHWRPVIGHGLLVANHPLYVLCQDVDASICRAQPHMDTSPATDGWLLPWKMKSVDARGCALQTVVHDTKRLCPLRTRVLGLGPLCFRTGNSFVLPKLEAQRRRPKPLPLLTARQPDLTEKNTTQSRGRRLQGQTERPRTATSLCV